MNTAQSATRSGVVSVFRRSLQHDPLWLPAVFVAVAGTAFASITPPAWLTRVPIAVQDVATGAREGLSNERDELAASETALSAQVAAGNGELSAIRRDLQKSETLAAERQEQRDVLNRQLVLARARLETLDAEQNQLRTALEQESQRADDLDEGRQQQEQLFSQLQDETKALQEGLSASEADRAAVSRMTAELEQKQAQLIENSSALEKERAARQTVQRQLDLARNEAVVKAGAVDILSSERRQLAERMAAAESRQTSLAAEATQLKDQLARAQAEASESRETVRASDDLRASLAAQLTGAELEARTLRSELEVLHIERDKITEQLALAEEAASIADSRIETLQAQQAGLGKTLEAVTTERDQLLNEFGQARELAELSGTQREAMAADLAEAQDVTETLTSRLADAERDLAVSMEERRKAVEQASDLQRQVEGATARLAELGNEAETAAKQRRSLEARLTRQRAELSTLNQEIDRLTRQRSAVQEEVMRLLAMLSAAGTRLQDQAQVIDASRANVDTLSGRVAELGRYRSEFLVRLGALLGDRDNVRVVGDRFVFQAEVLFATGSAKLGAGGKAQLATLAVSLKEIEGFIPGDLDWFLRIDGHTDQVPIRSGRFASNWELSQARALAVVHQLISLGVPPRRLAANGFGEYQPIEENDAGGANRQNRRIEVKLDQR